MVMVTMLRLVPKAGMFMMVGVIMILVIIPILTIITDIALVVYGHITYHDGENAKTVWRA